MYPGLCFVIKDDLKSMQGRTAPNWRGISFHVHSALAMTFYKVLMIPPHKGPRRSHL